jgi:hypothetical protein
VEAKLAEVLQHQANYEGTISDLNVDLDGKRGEVAALKAQLVRCGSPARVAAAAPTTTATRTWTTSSAEVLCLLSLAPFHPHPLLSSSYRRLLRMTSRTPVTPSPASLWPLRS